MILNEIKNISYVGDGMLIFFAGNKSQFNSFIEFLKKSKIEILTFEKEDHKIVFGLAYGKVETIDFKKYNYPNTTSEYIGNCQDLASKASNAPYKCAYSIKYKWDSRITTKELINMFEEEELNDELYKKSKSNKGSWLSLEKWVENEEE